MCNHLASMRERVVAEAACRKYSQCFHFEGKKKIQRAQVVDLVARCYAVSRARARQRLLVGYETLTYTVKCATVSSNTFASVTMPRTVRVRRTSTRATYLHFSVYTPIGTEQRNASPGQVRAGPSEAAIKYTHGKGAQQLIFMQVETQKTKDKDKD